MHNTTTLPSRQVLIWFLWFLVSLVYHLCWAMPGETDVYRAGGGIRQDKSVEIIGEVASRQEQGEEPFPWVTKRRWRLWVLKGYLTTAGFEVEEVVERQPYPDVEYQGPRAYLFARKPYRG